MAIMGCSGRGLGAGIIQNGRRINLRRMNQSAQQFSVSQTVDAIFATLLLTIDDVFSTKLNKKESL